MGKSLKEKLEEEWKKEELYKDKDVEAIACLPNQSMVEKCLYGCDLIVHENTSSGWAQVVIGSDSYDNYRHTKFCREHGFTRIYYISGINAQIHDFKLNG